MQLLWKLITGVAGSLAISVAASAEPSSIDPVVVRPTRLGAISSNTSVTVLTKEDLRDKNLSTLAEALKDSLGVDVATSGGPGQPSSVFIRGAKAEHTLVLIDGIEANDPTTTTRLFDFSSLTVENIERIEIYRGARATRFGADAIGGVINIITAKGSTETAAGISFEAGSYATRRFSSRFSGSNGRFNYSAGASQLTTSGFSSAAGADSLEDDGLDRNSLSTRMGWDFTDRSKVDFTFRFIGAETDLDASGGATGDDPNYESKSQQILTGVTFTTDEIIESLNSRFGVYLNSATRKYDNNPDPNRTTDYHETFQSDAVKVEMSHRYAFAEKTGAELIVQYRDESGESDQVLDAVTTRLGHQRQSVLGEMLAFDFGFDSLTFEAAVRHDRISTTSESVVSSSGTIEYRVEPTDTIFQLNFGTGFKNPSLFQLYSNFGSTMLRSEHAQTLDVSVDQQVGQHGRVSLTYFQTRFRNLIDFDIPSSKYANILNAKSEGLEAQTVFAFDEAFDFSLGFKAMTAKDEKTGLELLRRPAISGMAGLDWKFRSWVTGLRVRYSGEREDLDPVSFGRIRLAPYFVGSLSTRYAFSGRFEAYARIENLADVEYQEVAGYSASRRAYYAGLTANF